MTVETKNNSSAVVSEKDNSHLKCAAKATYSQQTQLDRNQLAVRFIPLVHRVASRTLSYLKPPLNYDDLVSAGTLGLLKAAQDYNPALGAEFITYAFIKIKGAILDELRRWSFIPQNLERQIQQAGEISISFMEANGRMPSDEELAAELNVNKKRLYNIYKANRTKNFVSIDEQLAGGSSIADFLASSGELSPDEMLEKSELIEELASAISELDEKAKQVIILYYQQNLTMRQIAETLKITEPRVSQIHSAAIFKLSTKLSQWRKDG